MNKMSRQFDELNTIEFEEYFGEMELPEEEKRRRIKLAENFEILFLFYFMSYIDDKKKDYRKMLQEKYEEIAIDFLELDITPEYIELRAKEIAEEVDRVTRENTSDDDEGDPEDQYYTSDKRAKSISVNEANVIGNYKAYIKAIKSGMRFKTWRTVKDKNVRHTHHVLDEKKIGIFQLFDAGGSKLMYPNDTSIGVDLKEIINCRCVVIYSKN